MRIGFVGTGSMGAPVARNLVRAGHDVQVFDVRPQAMQTVIELGATAGTSAAEVALDAEVVFLSLPSHLEVADVCFGASGLLAAAHANTYLIDLTTVSVDLVSELAEAAAAQGVRYLTSPVSQGVSNAEKGKLSLFVGGDPADLEACMPLYRTIGEVVIYTGDHVSAMAAKLLTNLLWFVNAAAIGEALVLGAKAGIKLPVLQQVVLNSCGTSWVAEHDIPSIYDGSFDKTFTTKLCTKDLRLIGELSSRLEVPTEMADTARLSFQRAEEIYGPDSPELSVVKYLQDMTQTVLQEE
jgi:3-hydroxyisobutyrate dehydrogenase